MVPHRLEGECVDIDRCGPVHQVQQDAHASGGAQPPVEQPFHPLEGAGGDAPEVWAHNSPAHARSPRVLPAAHAAADSSKPPNLLPSASSVYLAASSITCSFEIRRDLSTRAGRSENPEASNKSDSRVGVKP